MSHSTTAAPESPDPARPVYYPSTTCDSVYAPPDSLTGYWPQPANRLRLDIDDALAMPGQIEDIRTIRKREGA